MQAPNRAVFVYVSTQPDFMGEKYVFNAGPIPDAQCTLSTNGPGWDNRIPACAWVRSDPDGFQRASFADVRPAYRRLAHSSSARIPGTHTICGA